MSREGRGEVRRGVRRRLDRLFLSQCGSEIANSIF